MIADDLFAELDRTAAEYGWTRLGQPESHLRRYGKAAPTADDTLQVTVSVYANKPGTAIVKAARGAVGTRGRQKGVVLDTTYPGKRDQVILWLRWSDQDRRSE